MKGCIKPIDNGWLVWLERESSFVKYNETYFDSFNSAAAFLEARLRGINTHQGGDVE